jgi:hypothetical protein
LIVAGERTPSTSFVIVVTGLLAPDPVDHGNFAAETLFPFTASTSRTSRFSMAYQFAAVLFKIIRLNNFVHQQQLIKDLK